MLSLKLMILLKLVEDMAGFDELCFSLDYLFALCQKLASLGAINKEYNH